MVRITTKESPNDDSSSYIIFSTLPSKVKNERDFFLAGIFTSSRNHNFSIDMFGNLLLIHRNSDLQQKNPRTSPDIFSALLEPPQDIVEDAEIIIYPRTNDLHCNTRN